MRMCGKLGGTTFIDITLILQIWDKTCLTILPAICYENINILLLEINPMWSLDILFPLYQSYDITHHELPLKSPDHNSIINNNSVLKYNEIYAFKI